MVKVSDSINSKENRGLDNTKIEPHPRLNRDLLSKNYVNRS
ncbi:MAG: hypothetical protein ACI9SZ_000254 [Candidatus Thalassarchaeaceae archaeon]|jgi:hypothetical protein